MPSFDDLIYNPFASNDRFNNICGSANFFANLAYYIFYSILVVFVVYNIFVGIVKVTQSPGEEMMEKFRAAITNAVLAAVGLVILSSIYFIPRVIFGLVGIEGDNPFTGGKLCNPDEFSAASVDNESNVGGEDEVGTTDATRNRSKIISRIVYLDNSGFASEEGEGTGGCINPVESSALPDLANHTNCKETIIDQPNYVIMPRPKS